MTPGSILVCRGARGPHWQLGPLPPARGTITLIGWTGASEGEDAGVPDLVARVLARALTSVALVTFPSSTPRVEPAESWSVFDGGLRRTLPAGGIVAQTFTRLRVGRVTTSVIATGRPEVAAEAFDDGGFPWWLQGQVVLLSAASAPPPDVNLRLVTALLDDDWIGEAARLTTQNVLGVVRPGVDGAIAGLWSLDEGFERAVTSALEHEATDRGFAWATVTEAAFQDRLAHT